MDPDTVPSVKYLIRMDLLPYCDGGSMIPLDRSANCEGLGGSMIRTDSGSRSMGSDPGIRFRDPRACLHRGLFFWRGQIVGGDCPDVLFCWFPLKFRDFCSVRVFAVSDRVLALAGLRPAGARKPQGGTPSTPTPWLRPCPKKALNDRYRPGQRP